MPGAIVFHLDRNWTSVSNEGPLSIQNPKSKIQNCFGLSIQNPKSNCLTIPNQDKALADSAGVLPKATKARLQVRPEHHR